MRFKLAPALFAVAALSACAAGTGTTKGPMEQGTAQQGHHMAMSDRDMANMCATHQKMMSAKTPEERQALMAEHMKSMPPEMMQRHMEMMQSQSPMMCGHGPNQAPGK